jgi:hypothetical protein
VSLFDAFFGRTRLKKPRLDPLFAVAAATADLEARGIRLDGKAALSYRPVDAPDFTAQEKDWHDTLALLAKEKNVSTEITTDRYGYRWVTVNGALDDATTALHLVADSAQEAGYGGELLAAVFRGKDHHGDPFYLVYNYKRGAFYPFCPSGQEERRNAQELSISGQLDGILPVERDLERWYALWDLPL